MDLNKNENLVVSADFLGNVNLYSFKQDLFIQDQNTTLNTKNNEDTEQKYDLLWNKSQNVESINFDTNNFAVKKIKFIGDKIVKASSNGFLDILDLEGRSIQTIKQAHLSEIYTIYIIDDKTFITGDEKGVCKIWDINSNKSTAYFEAHTDIVNGIRYSKDKAIVYSVSIDSTIRRYNVKSRKLYDLCEYIDEEEMELNCIELFEDYNKIAIGNMIGSVDMYDLNNIYEMKYRKYPYGEKTKKLYPISQIEKISPNIGLVINGTSRITCLNITHNKLYKETKIKLANHDAIEYMEYSSKTQNLALLTSFGEIAIVNANKLILMYVQNEETNILNKKQLNRLRGHHNKIERMERKGLDINFFSEL